MKKTLLLCLLLAAVVSGCFAQDSIGGEKVLVVERTKLLYGQKTPTQSFFLKGNRVKVVSTNDDVTEIGRIKEISDSTITIKGKQIKVSKITRINKYRGVEPTILGGSIIGGGIITLLILDAYHKSNNDYNSESSGTGSIVITVLVTIFGGCTTLFGLIEMGATKHYCTNDHWKLYVKPASSVINKSNHPPNPFQTKIKPSTK